MLSDKALNLFYQWGAQILFKLTLEIHCRRHDDVFNQSGGVHVECYAVALVATVYYNERKFQSSF